MSSEVKHVEVNYNILNELFKIIGVQHSVPPTNEEFQQLLFTIQDKLASVEKKNEDEFEPIRNLLSLDPIDKTIKAPIKNNSILVVDDLVMVTYQMSILLSKMGYQVTLARSAPEAISQFKTHKYKYVLMDLHVPEKEDGLCLLHSIKNAIDAENLDTKIIIMSGMADAASVEYCLNYGASSFIEKDEDWKKEIISHLNKY